jgi:protein involved in polysaccharide export with SLBB domain
MDMRRNRILITILGILLGCREGLLYPDDKKLDESQRPERPTEAYSPPLPEAADHRDMPVLQQRNPRYRLRYGDVIELKFPLTPEFGQEKVTVQPDGFISLVGIEDIHVEGRTAEELNKLIKDAYSTVLRDPVIQIKLLEFEKPYFVVGGHVKTPGKYDMRGGTTVAQAVNIAGGISMGAKTSKVLLFRNVSDAWVRVVQVDLKKVLQNGDIAEDMPLNPGDMIYVPQTLYFKMKDWLPRPDALMWWALRGW